MFNLTSKSTKLPKILRIRKVLKTEVYFEIWIPEIEVVLSIPETGSPLYSFSSNRCSWPLHCDSSSTSNFWRTLVGVCALGRQESDLDVFSIKSGIRGNLEKLQKECPGWGSNSRPSDCSCLCDYETDALPTALPRHMADGTKLILWSYASKTHLIVGKACVGHAQDMYSKELLFDLVSQNLIAKFYCQFCM